MLLPLLFLQLLPLVYSQTVHNVDVGVEGSFFSPQSVAAAVNDTVNFIFGGDIHDVTQSTFEEPCTPLRGGFSSGLFGRGANFSGPTTVWSLTVTNASAPIWFFCAATRPVSHCASGMVGSINPPSQDSFASFVSAAKQVTGTPAFFPTLSLTGSGAIAATPSTIPNLPLPSSITSAPSGEPTSSNATSTSSTAASGGSSSSSTSSRQGAIIGGTIGGVVGAFLILVVLILCCRRLKKERRVSQESAFFSYNPRPNQPSTNNTVVSGMSSIGNSPNYITAFDVERESNAMMQKQPFLHVTSPTMSEYSTTLAPQRYTPNRSQSVGNLVAQAQGSGHVYSNPSINRQISFNTLTPATQPTSSHSRPEPSNSSTANDSGGPIDIQTLAKEVAAVLRHDRKSADLTPSSPAPPKYHTVGD